MSRVRSHDRDLPILPEPERAVRQLVDWNQTDVEYPDGACLHTLIAEQARHTPDAVVSDGQGTLSFAELDDGAGRLASLLRALGVGPETLVGVCLERSTDLVVALLGTLKAGGAFMPLEPDQPRQRLALMLSEARPAVVLTRARDRDALPPTDARLVSLDTERPDWMSRPPMVAPDCGPENLAYVLFTSGSTGTPKGVMVEHRSLVNHLVWRSGALGLTGADRILQKTPLSFDPALAELFCPLLTGASLQLLRPGDHVDPDRVAEAVRNERITVLGFVPSMLEEFISVVDPGALASLRLVTCGGEAMSPALVRSFFDRFGPTVELRNMYGPAEAVLSVSTWRCEPSHVGAVPIGRPVANTQIHLLGADLQPVPIGALGELCIGGVQVARGYLNQPALTAERFVANPFRPGERMYLTGDMARHRDDGSIDFLGRRDGQVKIRGVRVELGEIEAAIAQHADVQQAAAALRHDAEGQERLVAYMLPREGRSPSFAAMRAFLSDRLPDNMLPSALVIVDGFPRTHNGKVDRERLQDPDWRPNGSQADTKHTYTAPRTELEEKLARAWARTLGLNRVSVDADFFELGGHSLLAVRLLARVERELRVTLPVAALIEGNATVARLAAAIESAGDARTDRPAPLRAPSSETPPILFFVHPCESAMLALRHFTRALGPDQPVVGLLPVRKGARFDRSRSVEDLAGDLLRRIRATQPHGPYHLAGFSFGGLLAYEVAGQLRRTGQEVASLLLLDAAPPVVTRQAMRRRLSLPQRFARQRKLGLGGSLRHTGHVVNREVTAALVRLNLRQSRLADDFDWRGALKLASRYACPGNDAPTDLFVAAEGVAEGGSYSLGWEEVHEGSLHIHDVPGGHVSMMTEPHVSVVAELLRQCLHRAQAARGIPA